MLLSPQKIKEKNTKLLGQMGISVMESLPHLDKPRFRDSEEVITRAVVLAALLQLHFGAPNEVIKAYLDSNGLSESLTTDENERLSKQYNDWSDQEKTNLDWSIEAIWALMWCGGKHDILTFNTSVEDTLSSMLPAFHTNENPSSFISDYKLRTKKTIFTELDKFYRVHWFSKNNSLSNIEDKQVNNSIIMERRKALEWVCDEQLEWDDIPLDT
jgi:hypothetical protein